MKMKIKKDASNKSNSSLTSKTEERYEYDNLMRDPCIPKERSINNNKYLLIKKNEIFK